MNIKPVIITLFVALCGACSTTGNEQPTESNASSVKEEVVTQSAAMVKPDIDYSAETPDCETAGKRLAENVEVGMTLGDVRRLVGKPEWILPGSWRWSKAFGNGVPVVKFPFARSSDKLPVNGIITDTGNC